MGFNIKNAIGCTMIENKDGGVININPVDPEKIMQDVCATMDVDNIDDADFEDITEDKAKEIAEVVKAGVELVKGAKTELPKAILEAPEKTFTQNSDFVKNRFANAVMKYYLGKPTNLAYIAVVCDDWGMLKSRNHTLDFVRSCFAVGAIPYIDEKDIERINDTVKRQLNGQTRNEDGIKYRVDGLASDYKSWGTDKKDWIDFCDKVAKEFEGPGIFNRFEKRRETEAY